GTEQQVDSTPGSYLKISRNWKDGDVVELKMPFQFHLDPVMDQQNIASLFYGPILLAAQETEARKEWRKVTLDASDISKSIHGETHKLQYTIAGYMFKSFYDTYGRHSVYLVITLNKSSKEKNRKGLRKMRWPFLFLNHVHEHYS